MREDLTIKHLLERTHYLPVEEAEAELVLRKEQLALEMGVLQTALHNLGERGLARKKKTDEALQIGRAITVINADFTAITEAIKVARRKIDDASWRNAVKAVYGSEGYEKCRLWMAINTPMEQANAEREIAHLRSKGVTLDI